MRLASFEQDYWQLSSREQMHLEHPETFWIPPSNHRRSLQRGDVVKLVFEIEAYEDDGSIGIRGKRMWVIISDKVGDIYIGILVNQPLCLEKQDDIYLRMGAEVPFRSEHVIDISKPPQEYIDKQLAEPPDREWPRD